MAPFEVSRRSFLGASMASAVLAGLREESQLTAAESAGRFKLLWGDMHNHNAVGYGKGSLERSIDLAREHLDFFAFTGHASWHDLPMMPGDRHMVWVNGFKAHLDHWPKTRRLLQEANDERFVALLGYEWHSSQFGDYCMIFAEDQPELFLPDHVDKLLDFAAAKQALAIPHHLGYKQGWRGANWGHFRGGATSPVVEIMSEHGCAETDQGPFNYLRHSNGGRSTANTVQRQLATGARFGFVASSDDHAGYPGAYGEGVVGVWAEELSSRALFEAIRARRTYAASGDRIMLEVSLNGRPMGSELPATSDRQIDVRVEGQAAIASIELVRNGRVIERHFPEDHVDGPPALPGIVKCTVQYGWGPWGALALDRVCAWDMTVRLDGGAIRRAWGCFQNAPYNEELRDRLRPTDDGGVRLTSNTTRTAGYGEDPTKSLVLEVEGAREARLVVALRQPVERTIAATLGDLVDENVVEFTGGFTTESLILHRLVGPSEYSATVRWNDRRPSARGGDWYYVRVTQHNGHMAWSSPIWVG